MACSLCAFPLDLTKEKCNSNLRIAKEIKIGAKKVFKKAQNMNGLFWAIKMGHPECVRFYAKNYPEFVNQKVETNIASDSRHWLPPFSRHMTPLQYDSEREVGIRSPLQELFDFSHERKSQLMQERYKTDHEEILQILLENGSKIETANEDSIDYICDIWGSKEIRTQKRIVLQKAIIMANFCSCSICKKVKQCDRDVIKMDNVNNLRKSYMSRPSFLNNLLKIEVDKIPHNEGDNPLKLQDICCQLIRRCIRRCKNPSLLHAAQKLKTGKHLQDAICEGLQEKMDILDEDQNKTGRRYVWLNLCHVTNTDKKRRQLLNFELRFMFNYQTCFLSPTWNRIGNLHNHLEKKAYEVGSHKKNFIDHIGVLSDSFLSENSDP